MLCHTIIKIFKEKVLCILFVQCRQLVIDNARNEYTVDVLWEPLKYVTKMQFLMLQHVIHIPLGCKPLKTLINTHTHTHTHTCIRS